VEWLQNVCCRYKRNRRLASSRHSPAQPITVAMTPRFSLSFQFSSVPVPGSA
jgi:hypothetical protein